MDGIRTVASLGAEDAFYRQFKAAITKHYRSAIPHMIYTYVVCSTNFIYLLCLHTIDLLGT